MYFRCKIPDPNTKAGFYSPRGAGDSKGQGSEPILSLLRTFIVYLPKTTGRETLLVAKKKSSNVDNCQIGLLSLFLSRYSRQT